MTIYDCVLPQFDEHVEQRKQELEDKRDVYRMARKAPGIPKQVEVFVYSGIINPCNLQKRLIFRGLHNNNNYATRLFELRVKNSVIPARVLKKLERDIYFFLFPKLREKVSFALVCYAIFINR